MKLVARRLGECVLFPGSRVEKAVAPLATVCPSQSLVSGVGVDATSELVIQRMSNILLRRLLLTLPCACEPLSNKYVLKG